MSTYTYLMEKKKRIFSTPSSSYKRLVHSMHARWRSKTHGSSHLRQRLALVRSPHKMTQIFFESFWNLQKFGSWSRIAGRWQYTWTADTEASHWCVHLISVEQKRTVGLSKICRLPKSNLLLSLSTCFPNTARGLLKSILKQLLTTFCYHYSSLTSQQQFEELGIRLLLRTEGTETHLDTV